MTVADLVHGLVEPLEFFLLGVREEPLRAGVFVLQAEGAKSQQK